MDLEALVCEAIISEIKRQSEMSEGVLTASVPRQGRLAVHGEIDLEALAMVIVGSVAGGP
jgi:hypothetical protein